ncbi:hypothetical protein AgCh_038214 [Apium graveolens]
MKAVKRGTILVLWAVCSGIFVSRDERISVSVLIIRLPFESGVGAFTENLKKDAPERVAFLDVPALDDIAMAEPQSEEETKAILINTVWELESHAIKSFANDETTPLIYHVGPIIKFKRGEEVIHSKTSEEAIMNWLDSQPPSSGCVSVLWEHWRLSRTTEVVAADEIERGLRCPMDGGSEMRKKMEVLRATCRKATALGGSSYTSLGQFILDVTDNIREGALN